MAPRAPDVLALETVLELLAASLLRRSISMKRVMLMASAAVLLVAPLAFTQPPAAGQKIGLATSLQRGYAAFKRNFTGAAEKMPDADYTFKPGSTPEARTFAQVIDHIAQSQFGQCSTMKSVPNPMQGKQLEQELKTKAEVTKALAESFALCDDLFASVTDANATETIKLGQNEITRAAALYGMLVHGNEMYGTAAVYLRSKNLVPPSTENQGMRGRGHN
jgi:DinB superfamily